MTGGELRPTRLSGRWLASSLVVLFLAVVAGAVIGPADIDAGSVLASLVDRLPFVSVDTGLDGRQEAILWELRMPRVVLGVLVGGMLALSGGAYQGAFRNPLPTPTCSALPLVPGSGPLRRSPSPRRRPTG